jgi:hypothetical protein
MMKKLIYFVLFLTLGCTVQKDSITTSSSKENQCETNLTPHDIVNQLPIVAELFSATGSVAGAGRLQSDLIVVLSDWLPTLIQNPSGSNPLPEGFFYNGNGTYRIAQSPTDAEFLDIQLVLDKNYGFGLQGDPLPGDPFSMNSYLVNPSLSINILTSKLNISFASTGPLVELLGYGSNPANPIELPLNANSITDTLKNLSNGLKNLLVKTSLVTIIQGKRSSIEFSASTVPTAMSTLLSTSIVSIGSLTATGTDSSTGQTITATGEGFTIYLPTSATVFQSSGSAVVSGNLTSQITGGQLNTRSIVHFAGYNFEIPSILENIPPFYLLSYLRDMGFSMKDVKSIMSLECQ